MIVFPSGNLKIIGHVARHWQIRLLSCVVVFGACAAQGSAHAQDANALTDAGDWQFLAAPYAWAFGISGDVGSGQRQASVDADFIDILQKSDSLVGLQGHAEIQQKRFGMFFDGIYADITASASQSAAAGASAVDLDVDIDEKMAILEAGAFYQLVENHRLWTAPADLGGGTFSFDVLAGARYTYFDVNVDAALDVDAFSFKRDIDGVKDWVDPFIGGRIQMALTESVDFAWRGDVGGFGVGSDFTWNTQALLGYRFSLFGAAAEAWGGYRALAQDYDEGSGRGDFNWDVIMHGPVMGMSVRW